VAKFPPRIKAGISYAVDSLNPEGDIPIPLASMPPAGGTQPRDGGSETKDVVDIMLDIMQVINARTVMRFNVGMSQSSGYLNDPFKILSIVDANGRPVDYIYESRDDSRTKSVRLIRWPALVKGYLI